MSDYKFDDLFKIEATRLKNWDYSTPGWYFVTIVCHNFSFYFDNPRVKEIINSYWSKTPEHFAEVRLGEYIVMPNHMHGVIEITEKFKQPVDNVVETPYMASLPKLTKRTEDPSDTAFYKLISAKSHRKIPQIIQTFKAAVTRSCHKFDLHILWQDRYYDHVVRNEASLTLIENYIRDNPENWNRDRNNPVNLPRELHI